MRNLRVNDIDIQGLFEPKEVSLSCAGWAVFLLCAALYCIIYNQFVLVSPATLYSSFMWGLREYAPWPVVTPLLLMSLRYLHQDRAVKRHLLKSYLLLTVVVLFIALSCRVGLDIYTNPYRDFISSLVYFLPKQITLLGFVILAWHLFFGPRAALVAQGIPEDFPHNTSVNTHEPDKAFASNNLLVMKGSGECLIEWRSIDFISASGNYMELTCNAEKYLLRISMTQLEQRLPLDHFIRIHRSHIVNITAIERILSQPSGNASVELRNGQVLPLSKGYKQALKTYQLLQNS